MANPGARARAEVLKLARVPGHDAERLQYLEGVRASEIRALREQVTEVLFGAHGQLDRLAAVKACVPG